MQAMSISEGRKRLFELREKAVSDSEEFILTHKDGSVVLISMDEWESYQEAMRLFRDKEALQALLESFREHDSKTKRGKSPEEVFSDLI
ncbi:MAG: type II toxin-antitoxin system Phd/YefM family antitoxin [Candidatus Magnetobacterium sp. LHC-1]|uniref:Antitoxin n=1 Tax=Candidatus Magnetobacterium casense TaxID=1455061 RepID=A0ABS6RYU3_9BACT|nr:type II toxin-antitoxin system Phd/YefM family antitoxin [Candidatus Magnetobacterium casensis]MBV6341587.1 type II toxin-antitoxin system Phd/YefM family antitoxin [Candidatus Magnetobacterium casensis]